MHKIQLSESDIINHVVKIGIDAFPAIELAKERTHLNIFGEFVMSKWPNFYSKLSSGTDQFSLETKVVSNAVKESGATFPTFVLTPRGPVFSFPIRLPDPFGETTFASSWFDHFDEVRKEFFRIVSGHTILRVGLVREVVFLTGQTNCLPLVADEQEFAGAQLVRGKRLLTFNDDNYNYRLTVASAEIEIQAQHPIGVTVPHLKGHGLQVELDVNNLQIMGLEDHQIAAILERANSLWPKDVIDYVTGGAADE